MSGSVTVLDNTAGGTAAHHASGAGGGINTTLNRAYAFTTAAGSTWEIDGLRIAARTSSTAGEYTLVARLYATSGTVPTGGVLASVSLTITLGTTPSYYSFDKATLAALGTYSMAGGTGYALSWGSTLSGPGVVWTGNSTLTPPTASNGFVYGAYHISSDGGANWSSTPSTTNRPALQMLAQATCFLRGTLILTSRGEVAVERLRAGDLVATKFGGLRAIKWIGTQCFEGRLAGAGQQPIRFARGSLGGGVPSCDLFVSPGHAVLVGGVLAHAGALVNGSTITQEKVRGEIAYFHLDLGPHDCVLANGAWAESYFEDRNRDSFHNAAEYHARFPGHVAERQATCLPVVTAEHPGIGGLRARLAPAACGMAA